MRAMWTGTITFGLVNIPISVFTATEDTGPTMHQVHAADGGRIKIKRECQGCGEHIAYGGLAKGVEHPDCPDLVVLTSNEIADATGEKDRECEVLQFVEPHEIDPALLDTRYFLAPPVPAMKNRKRVVRPGHSRSYVMLRESLRSSGLVAIARITLRTRASLAVLSVEEDVLVMRTLLWADQLRAPVFDGYDNGTIPDAAVSAAELEQASQLIDAMRGKFDAAAHSDPYTATIASLTAEKLSPVPEVTPVDTGAQVLDLTARLAQSGAVATAVHA